jgi:hypothetical protein
MRCPVCGGDFPKLTGHECEQSTIDQIFEIRMRNNIPWKRLMEIALKHAPEEARDVLHQINKNDRAISDLMEKLEK